VFTVLRTMLAVGLLCALAVSAQAVPRGPNFKCGETTCVCDGGYKDCKNMETVCKGKLICPYSPSTPGDYCFCTYNDPPPPPPKTQMPKPLKPRGGGAIEQKQ
jgi:hypothetical protein